MIKRSKFTDETVRWLRDKRIFFEKDVRIRRLDPKTMHLAYDANAYVEPYCMILNGVTIPSIGAFSYSWSPLPAECKIGRYVSIATGLSVPGPRHPIQYVSTSNFAVDHSAAFLRSFEEDYGVKFSNFQDNPQKDAPVIGNDVWIGMHVAVMPGVTIGDGSVVAASSVVVKDVEPYTIVGGNPARPIRRRFSDRICEQLLEIRWWRYAFPDFNNFNIVEPERFIDEMHASIESLQEFRPERVDLSQMPLA